MAMDKNNTSGKSQDSEKLQDLFDKLVTYINTYTMKAEENRDREDAENDQVQELHYIFARMLTCIEKDKGTEDGKQEKKAEIMELALKLGFKRDSIVWLPERKGMETNREIAERLRDIHHIVDRIQTYLKIDKVIEQSEEGRTQEEEREEESRQGKPLGVIAVIALSGIILALLLASLFGQESRTQGEALRMFNNTKFDERLKPRFNNFTYNLEDSFPQQTPRFWKIIRNRATAHLKNPKPKKPLVFMFTAPPSAHNVLGCLARKFAQSLDYEDGGKEVYVINSNDYTPYSSLDDAKKYLDDKLKDILQKGQNVLVLDVDKLPVQSSLLFYEYCDNENAPYKHAAIIFTLRLPLEPDPSLAPAKEEGLVVEYLKETWSKQDYRLDDVPPLVARMTDTVVMVKKESYEYSCAF